MKLFSVLLTTTILLLSISAAHAASNRYQAHWNGKSYLIVDSDDGHIWTYRNDSMIYNGQIDGDTFTPPESPQIWQQNHGRWTQKSK